ncbi:phosphopantetheine-binding protein [Streptosporangium sp. NPDC048047]|uniref:acyl carrier protein n=1 Tax=Streptosporangium sp. NPDC048047 TaxID=3155748 RepID=UPI0034301A2B
MTDGHPGDMTRERMAELLSWASDGKLTVEEILSAECTLPALGVDSLTYIRLIDAIDDEYGVDVDMGGNAAHLDTVDGLVRHVAEARSRAGRPPDVHRTTTERPRTPEEMT